MPEHPRPWPPRSLDGLGEKVDTPGWYVSDEHCKRAVGYLSASLAQKGYLPENFELPQMLEWWGEALEKTIIEEDPSPIGPDRELAKDILNGELGSETPPGEGTPPTQ